MGKATPYRPGGFILHPGVVAVVLVAVAVWLGLFFVGESTHGLLGVVVYCKFLMSRAGRDA